MKSCVTISLVEEARGGPFVLWDALAAGCETAGRLGFDAVEVFPPDAEAIRSQLKAEMLKQHNLQLAAVGTGGGWVKHRLSLADGDQSVRKRAVAFVCEIIDAAAEHGAMAIIGSMQGRHGGDVSRDDARGYLLDALDHCGRRAAAHGTTLLFEPLNRYESNQANTIGDALGLLDRLGTDHSVRLLADLFHMRIEEVDVAAALIAAGDRLGHVHFVDSNRRAAGFGNIDYRPIMNALVAIRYNGYLSAEAFPLPDSEIAAAQTRRAFEYWTGVCPD